MKDSQEEIMELKAGIEISKGISHLAILFFKKYLEVLQHEESLIKVQVIQSLAGHLQKPQRRRYLDLKKNKDLRLYFL